ncbi:MAG: type II secretion system secretin GspD [Pseudomonadota bacterium]
MRHSLPALLILALATPLLAQDEAPELPAPAKLPVLRNRAPRPVDPLKRQRVGAATEGEGRGPIAPPGKRGGLQRVEAETGKDASAPAKAPARAPAKAAAKAAAPGPAGEDKIETVVASEIDGEARFKKGKGYFNFDKADLLDVVKQIAKLTRMNFIIPERLKTQKITIICEKPVTTEDAYRAFLTALEINSLNLVPSGKFYKIEQRKDSVRQPIPTLMDDDAIPNDDAMVTAVLEFEHVEVDSVQKVVQNLMSKDGTLQTLASNLMILADSGANILRIKRILAKLDIEGSTNQIHIVDIQYAAASDIAQKLTQLFEAPKGKGAKTPIVARPASGAHSPDATKGEPEEESVVLVKSIADDRTNKLILICSKRSFDRIKEIIEILDVPVEEGTQQVHVYYLNNAVAEEISRTVSTLAQGAGAAAAKGKKPAGQVSAAELFEGQVKVTADKATNALVIVATGRDYKRLIKVVERLDVRRPQVFVEAVIMEVSLSKQVDLGLNLFTGYKAEIPGLGEGYGLATNPGGQGLISSTGTSAAVSSITGGSSSAVSATNLAAFLGFLAFRGPIVPGSENVLPGGLPSFGAVMQAVQKDADVDVLSTPHILTTDNEKAEILVGQNVPFAGSISGGGGTTGGYGGYFPMVSVQRQDVALKFAVTPHISEDNQVRLEIEQEISDLGEYIDVGFGQKQPVTTKKNAKTTVVVRDQQTIILGGLISSRKDKSETKIPILGDLPLIGWAFKTHGDNQRKTNLLLVLTPYIIEGDEDFRRIYERKLRERQEFLDLFYGGEDAFNAPVEYAKKTGAYGAMHHSISREMRKVENGGPGFGDEILVSPPKENTIDIAPQGGDAASTGDGEAAPTPIGEEGMRNAPALRRPDAMIPSRPAPAESEGE